MKRKITFGFLALLMITAVIAAGPSGVQEPGTAIENPDMKTVAKSQENGSAGKEGQGIGSEMSQRIRQEMQQKIQAEGQGTGAQKQNRVRETVHMLNALRKEAGLEGGIGQNISEIARGFNNSAKVIEQNREEIRQRSGFTRFFAGGDAEAADKINQQVNQNQQRVERLQQLRDQMPEDVRDLVGEQVQQLEQEQKELKELALEQKNKKGLFGWIWK